MTDLSRRRSRHCSPSLSGLCSRAQCDSMRFVQCAHLCSNTCCAFHYPPPPHPEPHSTTSFPFAIPMVSVDVLGVTLSARGGWRALQLSTLSSTLLRPLWGLTERKKEQKKQLNHPQTGYTLLHIAFDLMAND